MPTGNYEWNYYYQNPYSWKTDAAKEVAANKPAAGAASNYYPFGSNTNPASTTPEYPTWYNQLTNRAATAPTIDWQAELAKLTGASDALRQQQQGIINNGVDWQKALAGINQQALELKKAQDELKLKAADWQNQASAANAANIAAQQAANAARIPGAAGMESQSSQNIANALAGKLPADVIGQLQRNAAERGLASGLAGSQAGDAAYMRALGLNSLGLQNQGQQWLNAAYARNPGAPLVDPTAFMLTPGQESAMNLGTSQLLSNVNLAGLNAAQQANQFTAQNNLALNDLLGNWNIQGLGLAQRGQESTAQNNLALAKLMADWDLQASNLAQRDRELKQQAELAQQQLGVQRMNAMTPSGGGGGGYRGTSNSGLDWNSLFGGNSGFNYYQQSGRPANPNATATTGSYLSGSDYLYNPTSYGYNPTDFSSSNYGDYLNTLSQPLYNLNSGFNFSPAPIYDVGAGFNYYSP